jgi:site-specific DNA-methyltransferase (adenine-specific)
MSKVKKINELLIKLKDFKNAKSVIEKLNIDINEQNNIESKSQQGFIYERLWDIVIKFGLVKNIIKFDKDNKLLHFNDNVNNNAILDKIKFNEFKDFFDTYLNSNIQSGNSGGYSDITFRNNDIIVLSSCKYYQHDDKKDIKKYELHNLCPIIEKNSEPVKIVLFIKNKTDFIKKIKNANKSSLILSNYINPYGNYENVYDLNNLEIYFSELKIILNYYNYFKTKSDITNFKKTYLNEFKQIFKPKFHQYLFINQIDKIIKKSTSKNILIGAIPRTGKTYILAGTIKKFLEKQSKTNEHNFLIITPAPTETIPQYIEVFNSYLDFDKINLVTKNNIKNYVEGSANVFIFSKQTLDCDNVKCTKDDINKQEAVIIQLLKKIKFDIIFIDEAHYGMTTEKSKLLLDIKKLDDPYKIFITATYNKPIKEFDIPDENKLLWSLENVIDLIRIANNNNDDKIELFKEKIIKNIQFDKDIIKDVIDNVYGSNYDNIINQYKNFPEPYLLTTVWKNTDDIYNEIRLANGLYKYTFTMDTLFNLKSDNDIIFENEEYLIELFHYFYGFPRKHIFDDNGIKYDVNYEDRHKYREYGIIPRIRNICQNNCRTLQQSTSNFRATSQLWFLPINNNKLENKIPALLHLLLFNFKNIFNQTLFLVAITGKISDKYKIKGVDNIIYDINDKNDIKKYEDDNNITKKYKNIVILTGFKFNLGISLPNVDIVVLFNNSKSVDLIYQMMFRSMTDINDNFDCVSDSSYCHKKKYGFIVDLNPQRTVEIINYIKNNIISSHLNENKLKEKFMDLLNVDKDFYRFKFDDEEENIQDYTKSYFKKLSLLFNDTANNIYNDLKNFTFEIIDIKEIKDILKSIDINKTGNKIIGFKEGIDENFKNKIKKIKSNENGDDNNDGDEDKDGNGDDEEGDEEKDEIKDEEKIKLILSELIVILPIITNINIKCVINDKITIKQLINNLISNLNIIKKDDKLQDIFIDLIRDRCKINKFDYDFNKYYDFFITLIDNLNNKKSKSKPKTKIIDSSICEKWMMNNKLINPFTNRKMTTNSIMYKKLLKNCQKKGGINKNKNTEIINKLENTIESISNKINNINNPKELLEYINASLKPTDEKKRNNSEVFTPIHIIEEMMDKLTISDPSIWSNPNIKWLDPAAGMGNFMVVVYLRLMNGLMKFKPNLEDRRKWILEKMLFMVEYDKVNSFMMSRIFCGNKYKLNIFTGSFINGERYVREGVDIFSLDETDIEKYKSKYKTDNIKFCKAINKFRNKFDIIIGNPPFNNERDSPIYNKFVEKSLELTSKYLLFITPSRWFSGGKGLDGFRKMMLNRTDIELIKHYEKASNIFGKDVAINGGVNYFLINKFYKGLCNINNSMIKLSKYDILITNTNYYSIIDKLMKYPSIASIYHPRGHFGIETNNKKLSNKKINSNYIICYVSQQKGNIKYIDKRFIKNDITKWKVITSEAYGASKYFGNIFIGKPSEVCTSSFISFEVNNEYEAKSLLSYLKTRFSNFMLSLRKNTQHIAKETIKWIPLPPLDRIWNDEEIFKYFKLNAKEIELIKGVKY